MSALTILQVSLFLTALLVPNYADQSFVQSPIVIGETVCGGYMNLEVSMADVKSVTPQEDAERGSFIV